MKQKRRLWAAVTAAAMLCGFAACSPRQETGKEAGSQPGDGALFADHPTIRLMISSHPSWPYNENWKIWQYFAQGAGAELDVRAIPHADYDTKVSLLMSTPEELPDLMHFTDKMMLDKYAMDGPFAAIDDNLDKLPNYTAFLDSLAETERQELLLQRTSGDGKIYCPPVYGTQTVSNLRTWMYRKDVFEKNGLTPPKTMEELYTVAKKLKELYPESYPFCCRTGLYMLEFMASEWKPYFGLQLYCDFNSGKWGYGAYDPTMKTIVEYFRTLCAEGLVPPDFLTIENKSWEALISTDRGFLMFEYLVRMDFFNKPNRVENPAYTWAPMAPPKGNTPEGQMKVQKTNVDFSGYVVCNGKDAGRMDNAFRLLDWMYSDEGSELLSWGRENETYEVTDGKKRFILPNEDSTPTVEYGVATSGLYQRMDPAAYEAQYTEEQIAAGREAVTYAEDHANPIMWLALNEEEQKRANELKLDIDTYASEMLSKFMLGQEELAGWDAFQKSLKQMGVEELISLYQTAYDRVATAKAS